MNKKFSIQRRNLLKALFYAAGAPACALIPFVSLGQSNYSGKLLMVIQLNGGVDVTSFCDPKINIAGEPEINRWARTDEVRLAGNIAYAPYAENERFFDKYFLDMLVVNGVDSQTNSHTVGELHNWSGRNAEGFPTLTALVAAVQAPDLPMSYLNFGGFGNTQDVIRSTRIGSIDELKHIIFPNTPQYATQSSFRNQSDWDRIQNLRNKNMQRLVSAPNTLGGNRKSRQLYNDAITRADGLQAFGELIPDANIIQPTRNLGVLSSTLHQQIQVTLLAFKSGVSITADLFETGFDTHQYHDRDHVPLLGNATDAIDYLWSYAEELGLADRLVVLIGSDFGRTPFFNASEGKDHWPIGSYVVMEKNAPYTNRVYGETDGGHNAHNISPSTLVRDDNNGVIIRPAHVHKALRKYLGIDTSPITQRFPFNNIEEFDFFS